MLLGLDHIDSNRIAAIDSEGGVLRYRDISDLSARLQEQIPERALCFLLVENNVGGIVWVMSMLAARKLVPLVLNVKTEETLLQQLLDTYQPSYICTPDGTAVNQVTACEKAWGYTLYETGNPFCALHPDLSHLLPTSGRTGSPKLVRHMYSNIEAAGLNISTFFELKETDRPLMVLPLYYTMGLSMVFSHLRVGATILITGRNMTDPVFWKFLKEQRASSFTGVPYSVPILDLMRFFRLDLPDLE